MQSQVETAERAWNCEAERQTSRNTSLKHLPPLPHSSRGAGRRGTRAFDVGQTTFAWRADRRLRSARSASRPSKLRTRQANTAPELIPGELQRMMVP